MKCASDITCVSRPDPSALDPNDGFAQLEIRVAISPQHRGKPAQAQFARG